MARRQNRFGLVPRWIKFLIAGVALALAAVPATFIVTLLLYPFWSWVEATYRIESIGHSGPADWCFIVVYGVFLVLLLLLLWCGWRHRVIRSKLPRRAAKGMPAVPRRTIAMKRTSMEQRMEWKQRLADLWASIDQLSEQAFLSKMEFLVAELPPDSAVAAFERAGSFDSTGHSDLAVPLYRKGLELGLEGQRRRRPVIQMASSLHNLGQASESVPLLMAERERESDDLDAAVSAALALALVDVG